MKITFGDTANHPGNWHSAQPQALEDFIDILERKGGGPAIEAFVVGIVQWLQANPAATYNQWKAAYIVLATVNGWFANVTVIQSFIQGHFGIADWAEFVGHIQNIELEEVV